jgi:isopentenyl phosphate kinase
MHIHHHELVFLKLGGSLITKKDQPMTARLELIQRILSEIKEARLQNPDLYLILGHGSGSFGHTVAKEYNTRNGVTDDAGWEGFFEVYTVAKKLNQLVQETGAAIGLPLIPFALSSSATVKQRQIVHWNLTPLQQALTHRLIPMVYGDVAFDEELGGTILSTEEIFFHLTGQLHPARILLAGIEPGIWLDYPQNTSILKEIRKTTWEETTAILQGSTATDVTGGMKSKVESMLEIIQLHPDCEISIFSGAEPGSIKDALLGKKSGTTVGY